MKKITHFIYLTLIAFLIIAFILKQTNCPEIKKQKLDEELIHWTLGVDYSKLKELKEPELLNFAKKIEEIVSENNWELFISNCEPEHYETQFEELDYSKSEYVQNNLMIYSTYEKNIEIVNQLPEIDNSNEFASLNLIKKMNILGINELEKYEGIISLCGYVELKDNTIRAVNIWVTKLNGKYEITGAVG